LKTDTLGETAGLSTFPFSGAGLPFGQHFHFAMPEAQLPEFWLAFDPGVTLAEAAKIPSVAVPVNGKLVPSDAPGFGMDIKESWLTPWA